MIKDSGERKEFETGAVRDIQEGKGRCDLLPLDVIADLYGSFGSNNVGIMFRHIDNFCRTGNSNNLYDAIQRFVFQHGEFEDMETAILELSKHFEEGALKYGEYNWQKGLPTHCYISSAVRHYLKYLRGDDDERHDRAFLWNLVCCIWTVQHYPNLDDIPHGDAMASAELKSLPLRKDGVVFDVMDCVKKEEFVPHYKNEKTCDTCYYGKHNPGCCYIACNECNMYNGSGCKCSHIKDGEICPYFTPKEES